MNTARKLSLEEIASLPKAAVVWCEIDCEDSDNPEIRFFIIRPLLVCVPGMGGSMIGGDSGSYIDVTIDENIFDNGFSYWNSEPNAGLIMWGLTEEEYNSLDDKPLFGTPGLKARIIADYGSIESFVEGTGMSAKRLKKCLDVMTGDFMYSEMIAIVDKLKLKPDEARRYFFPD